MSGQNPTTCLAGIGRNLLARSPRTDDERAVALTAYLASAAIVCPKPNVSDAVWSAVIADKR